MTQALAGFNEHGIVLATDSRATRFDAAGEPEIFSVNKLFALNRRCAILSGGAGVSVSLSFALRRQIARHPGPLELEELVDFAAFSFPRTTPPGKIWPGAEGFGASTLSWRVTFPTAPRPTFK
jgi:hypothetical protein